MGTSALIAVTQQDGTFRTIMVNWDGYPEHTGRCLREHFTDPVQQSKLLALGNLSVIGAGGLDPNEAQPWHDSPPDVCVAYGRDRGEHGQQAQRAEVLEDVRRLASSHNYLYVWQDSQWMFCKGCRGQLHPV